MPKLKFEEIERSLSNGKLAPVYLIYGAEEFLKRIVVDKIARVYKAETGAEVERYSSVGLDAVKLLDGLKTLPMWSKGKLAIVSGASSLTQKSRDLILKYIESPADSTVLILVASKFDNRTKLGKALVANGVVCELSTVYENQMPVWISRMCRKKGYNISHDAAQFMAELVGTNLSSTAEAVEKIILFIGSKKTIDLKDIETVLSDTSQKSIFDLANAVGSGDLSRAVNRLANLLRYNESPVVVVNMLARHWRLLLKSKELIQKGVRSENDIARAIQVNRFFVREYISQAKRFKKMDLIGGIKELWQADIAVKSSRLPREAILNRLIISLIKPA